MQEKETTSLETKVEQNRPNNKREIFFFFFFYVLKIFKKNLNFIFVFSN
jgi:hypothetical protein